MSIEVKDVEKILLDLGIHKEGVVDMNLANSIVRTMGAHGQQEATEEFVRSYLIEGGTLLPDREEAVVDIDPVEDDPNHVIDEDEDKDR